MNQFDALLRFVRPSLTPDVKYYDGFGNINPWTGKEWEDTNPWIHTEEPQYDDDEFIDYSTPIAKLFHPELQAVTSTATKRQHSATAEPQTEETDLVLSKRFATERRKAAIRAHVQRQLAIGETIESLAKYARQHDEETALLIEEIGAELCA